MQGDFSDAVPFLKRPINLDGEYAGDVGFDPLVSNLWQLPSCSRHLLPLPTCCAAASLSWTPCRASSLHLHSQCRSRGANPQHSRETLVRISFWGDGTLLDKISDRISACSLLVRIGRLQ